MIRVLHVLGSLARGGVETFLMNYYRHIDKSVIQFDFVICTDNLYCYEYEQEILSLGGKVYKIRNGIKGFREFGKILKTGEYKIVHSHRNAYSTFYLTIAYLYSIPVRISHSHNDDIVGGGLGKRIATTILKPILGYVTTQRFACADASGKFLYGHRSFITIKNAIDVDRFKYDSKTDKAVRVSLGIGTDDFVVGHTGMFLPAKNHRFILEVFGQIHQMHPKSKLVLVGSGELLENASKQAAQMDISDSVIFTGSRNDVDKIIQCFDFVLFPSLSEGLPFSMLEMQAASLRILCSDTISAEVNQTGEVYFKSLEDSARSWAETALSLSSYNKKDIDTQAIIRNGYDLNAGSEFLKNCYLSALKES